MFGILKKIFGTKSQREIKKMIPLVRKINELEEFYQKLTEEQLRAKTQEFKDRYANGESLDSMLCEAFAVVKNTCRRLVGTKISVCGHEMTWDMIPYDVQIIGGIVLHRGNIAEMATGEGKTLVATMPLYLNALTGKNCQLVTVNDYLARRDSEWMGTIYKYLGLTVGCIQNSMSPSERREQYNCDITYGTNSEFGFDYLRDMGMATDKEQLVQRDYYYAIIDEVDSILIDEARTPLIISGPVAVSSHQFNELKPLVAKLYNLQNNLCSRLIHEAREVLRNQDAHSDEEIEDAIVKVVQVKMGMPTHKQLRHLLEDGSILKKVEKTDMFIRSDQNRGLLQKVQEYLYFVIDEKSHEADLTEKGRNEVSPNDPDHFVLPDLLEELHKIENDPSLSDKEKLERKQKFQDEFSKKSERLHNLSQLLKAYCLFEKDVHYVVQDNKVLIVDEHTGRLMPGRRFSEGLHQALEAKEGVTIEKETQTLATITIQNYFRMYEKLAGMTGTAVTEATEFYQIYKLEVIEIPTNKPCQRVDLNDRVYKTKRAKYRAIINRVEECYKKGQPVLLGTISVEVSEVLSRMLKRRRIPHNVLNAKNHEREAEIVARAGQKGAVTVATNMAGRGTDIKLGEGVAELGGLFVIGSERHDARRIDRQLRGRCARQGDPGYSEFYVSLEDNLMRLFGSDKVVAIMEKFGLEEDDELQHPLLNRSIETAQKRVEQHHFAIRKGTLEFDDVMNKQREVIYNFRKETLLSENPKEIIMDILEEEIKKRVYDAIEIKDVTKEDETFNLDSLLSWLSNTFPIGFSEKDIFPDGKKDTLPEPEPIIERILKKISDAYAEREQIEAPEYRQWVERNIILEAIDRLWQDHLYAMDHLRASIGLRVYAQKDPLIEYKQEAFHLFSELMDEINREILSNMFKSSESLAEFENVLLSLPQEFIHQSIEQFGSVEAALQQMSASGGIVIEPQTDGSEIQGDMQISEEDMIEVPVTFVRTSPKIGRNDPCPCGSGKKYKKCCGK